MLDFFLDIEGDKSSSGKTNSGETGQIEHVFNAINANLSSELVSKTGAIYQFNVKGNLFLFIFICYIIIQYMEQSLFIIYLLLLFITYLF